MEQDTKARVLVPTTEIDQCPGLCRRRCDNGARRLRVLAPTHYEMALWSIPFAGKSAVTGLAYMQL
jgi:hypothetical protein